MKKYIVELIDGGIAGAITSIPVLSASIGAELPPHVILVIGISNIVIGSIAIFSSTYLSVKSELEAGYDSRIQPLASAMATTISFAVTSIITYMPFMIALVFKHVTIDQSFPYIFLSNMLSLIILGVVKSHIASLDIMSTIAEVVALGGMGAIFSFMIGIFYDRYTKKHYQDGSLKSKIRRKR